MGKLWLTGIACMTAALIVVRTALAGGACIDDSPCTGVVIDEFKIVCCAWDHGCWLNPFEPDGQWWCDLVEVIKCVKGGYGTLVESSYECGPCCEPEPVTP